MLNSLRNSGKLFALFSERSPGNGFVTSYNNTKQHFLKKKKKKKKNKITEM